VKLKAVWLATFFLFYLVGVATGVFVAQRMIANVAVIKTVGVGVYKDIDCTLPLTQIDWGVLEPGATKSFTAYLRNESNVPISLNMTIQNWIPPEAESHISISWDQEGKTLQANQVVSVVFTLSVSADITGINSFSFEIVTVGSG